MEITKYFITEEVFLQDNYELQSHEAQQSDH